MTSQQDPDAGHAYRELAALRLAEQTLPSVLARIAALVQQVVPRADEVSVTLVREGAARTVAATGPLSVALDERQYGAGQGPCLEAAVAARTLHLDDPATEQRWPAYVPGAREAGLGSSLSVPVPGATTVQAALNLYSRDPGAFGQQDLLDAETFATYAGVAIANVELHVSTRELAEQLQEAIASRAVIDQAKGILMGQRRCSADEAFDLLVTLSQTSNRKLREVAQALVDRATSRDEAGGTG